MVNLSYLVLWIISCVISIILQEFFNVPSTQLFLAVYSISYFILIAILLMGFLYTLEENDDLNFDKKDIILFNAVFYIKKLILLLLISLFISFFFKINIFIVFEIVSFCNCLDYEMFFEVYNND